MKDKERQELNCWIAKWVMGWKRVESPSKIVRGKFFYNGGDTLIHYGQAGHNQLTNFKPTNDPAAAMEVLKKCASHSAVIITRPTTDSWRITTRTLSVCIEAETLELAIALFAKKIFSK